MSMRLHFISRLALLLTGAFLVLASQVWGSSTLEWLFIAGGAVMIVLAMIDSIARNLAQRSIDGLLLLVGAWAVVEALVLSGLDLKWWSFGIGLAGVGLAALGLVVHEMTTERVVHELSVTGHPETSDRLETPVGTRF